MGGRVRGGVCVGGELCVIYIYCIRIHAYIHGYIAVSACIFSPCVRRLYSVHVHNIYVCDWCLHICVCFSTIYIQHVYMYMIFMCVIYVCIFACVFWPYVYYTCTLHIQRTTCILHKYTIPTAPFSPCVRCLYSAHVYCIYVRCLCVHICMCFLTICILHVYTIYIAYHICILYVYTIHTGVFFFWTCHVYE